MRSLNELTQEAIEDLKDEIHNWDYRYDQRYDLVHQFTERYVPIYYRDILEVAKNDIARALEIPECSPVDWSATPISLMTSNIYEHIYNELIEILSNEEE